MAFKGLRVGDSSPPRIGSLLNRPWLYSKGEAPASPWVGAVGLAVLPSTALLAVFWPLGLRFSMLREAFGFFNRKWAALFESPVVRREEPESPVVRREGWAGTAAISS